MHLRGQGALKGSSVGKACGDMYNHLTTLEKIVLEEKRGYCSDLVENHVNDNLKGVSKSKSRQQCPFPGDSHWWQLVCVVYNPLSF